MKPFDLNTPFSFGKYEGQTLSQVFDTDPAYVDKCLVSVEDFSIDEKSLQQLFEKYPDYEMSDAAIDANLDKLDTFSDGEDDDDLIFSDDAYDADDFDSFESKGKLGKEDDWDDLDAEDDFDDEDDNWEDEPADNHDDY